MASETIQHRELKRLAIEWLRRLGCCAVATEVRCPISRWRVDVAGWLDHSGGTPETIIIECKQARSDFLRDDANREELLRLRTHLEKRRAEVEETRVKPREPHLRESGSALFPELETWDFAASRVDSYRRILRELRQVEKRLHGETKFGLLAQYRLADRLYLFTPSGLIKKSEVPRSWGLLEASGMRLRHPMPLDAEAPLPMRERIPPVQLDAPEKRRVRLLRNIAIAASRRSTETVTERPQARSDQTDAGPSAGARVSSSARIDGPFV